MSKIANPHYAERETEKYKKISTLIQLLLTFSSTVLLWSHPRMEMRL